MSTTTTTSTGTQPKIPSNPTWHESQVLAKHNQQQCELWGLRESFDEDRDVNDKTLSNAAMSRLSKLIEEFTARLESKEEISGWAQNACAFIQNLDTCCGTDAAERLFRHIDDSEKFQKEKTQWKNRLKNTDSVVLHGKLYPLEEKVLEDIGKASWSIAKWAKSKTNPIEQTQKAILNWEDVKYRASSEDDEEMDPDPEKNFHDRVRNEPSKGHFRQVSLKLGAPRKRFDKTLARLHRWTNTPSLADPEDVAAEMKLLKLHFKELQKIRAEATKAFNPFTRSVDTYMDEMLAQYQEIGQTITKFIPEATDFLERGNEKKGEHVKRACPNCASAEMSVGDLREHQKVCHPAHPRESEDDELHTPERRTPSPMPSLSRSQKRTKKLPPNYHTSGSYGGPRLKPESSSDTSDSSASSMLTTSTKRKKKRDDLTKLFERFLEAQSDIAKVQAKSQFKPELYCSVFDPAKIKPAEMLSAYRNWRIELKDLEDAMKTVTLKKTQNYKYLKGRLAGTAKELIRENNPDEKSYARAVRKLDENYWSKQLHIKDLMHKLRNIRPMAESSAALVSDFSSNVNSLMNEIMDNLGRREENEQLYFLLFSEIIIPKFNREAMRQWEKLTTNDEDEFDPLGHSLTLKDLKKVMKTTKNKLRHREFTKVFNSNQERTNEKKEAEKKAKEAEKALKKETQDVYSFGTHMSPTVPKDPKEGDPCPVPNCGKLLKSGKQKGNHLYITTCPELKKQTPESLMKWFTQSKMKCKHCFSVEHKTANCQFKETKCPRKVKGHDGIEKPCGGSHNFYLHVNKTPTPQPRKAEGSHPPREE